MDKMLTVAIVEDYEEIARHMKRAILEEYDRNIQVLISETFRTTEDLIKDGLADIYIIDLGLPDGNGEDLIRRIRSKSKTIPIIVSTMNDDTKYKLKITKEFKGIRYCRKDKLLKDMSSAVFWGIRKADPDCFLWTYTPSQGPTAYDSVPLDEIYYIKKPPEAQGIDIEHYKFGIKEACSKEIKDKSLEEFLNEYNENNVFLRCHDDYIVNRKMVEKVFVPEDEILMKLRWKGHSEIRIPVSPEYKKDVLSRLKGLYPEEFIEDEGIFTCPPFLLKIFEKLGLYKPKEKGSSV